MTPLAETGSVSTLPEAARTKDSTMGRVTWKASEVHHCEFCACKHDYNCKSESPSPFLEQPAKVMISVPPLVVSYDQQPV